MTKLLLYLALVASIATVLAPQLPGAWWQYALIAFILVCAAGVQANNDA